MNEAQSPLSPYDPRILAFEMFKLTESYGVAVRWMSHPQLDPKHLTGLLWAAFVYGWTCAEAPRRRSKKP